MIPIPGASAILSALVAAGLPTDTFLFLGFLPHKAGARRNRLGEFRAVPATLVAYESPAPGGRNAHRYGRGAGRRPSGGALP